ncbi:MAG: DUF5998 family protein [Actinomycetes bacterium]
MTDQWHAVGDLQAAIQQAGYYPELVGDTVSGALAAEPVRAYVVHQETTFDGEEVRRHLTVLALTSRRLVVCHTDDHVDDSTGPTVRATTSVETTPIGRVVSVALSRTVTDPAGYVPGSVPEEAVLSIGWGAAARIDLEPAGCGDPQCEADHGYSGTASADDISLRVSAAAEGADVVAQVVVFAAALAAIIGGRESVRVPGE